jgi:hypothetical protein
LGFFFLEAQSYDRDVEETSAVIHFDACMPNLTKWDDLVTVQGGSFGAKSWRQDEGRIGEFVFKTTDRSIAKVFIIIIIIIIECLLGFQLCVSRCQVTDFFWCL